MKLINLLIFVRRSKKYQRIKLTKIIFENKYENEMTKVTKIQNPEFI